MDRAHPPKWNGYWMRPWNHSAKPFFDMGLKPGRADLNTWPMVNRPYCKFGPHCRDPLHCWSLHPDEHWVYWNIRNPHKVDLRHAPLHGPKPHETRHVRASSRVAEAPVTPDNTRKRRSRMPDPQTIAWFQKIFKNFNPFLSKNVKKELVDRLNSLNTSDKEWVQFERDYKGSFFRMSLAENTVADDGLSDDKLKQLAGYYDLEPGAFTDTQPKDPKYASACGAHSFSKDETIPMSSNSRRLVTIDELNLVCPIVLVLFAVLLLLLAVFKALRSRAPVEKKFIENDQEEARDQLDRLL